MASQSIEKTFVGTSAPVSFEYSLSYYGPKGLDAEKTTIGASGVLLDVEKKVGWDKAHAILSWNLTAGLALPSWSADITVKDGTITHDSMVLNIAENTVMGGTFFGLLINLHLSLEAQQWVPGHPAGPVYKPHWVSGHWTDLMNKSHDFHFDVIPMGLDLIWDLRTKIPAFKKLIALLPQGLLDHMQDFHND